MIQQLSQCRRYFNYTLTVAKVEAADVGSVSAKLVVY